MIYKGLSVAFEKKLNFGLVRSSDTVLAAKYAVVPLCNRRQTGEKKPIFFKWKGIQF